MTKSLVHVLLKIWQGWYSDYFPRETAPVTNHILSEEPFPKVPSEVPLMQLHLICSCSIAGHQREEISTWPHSAIIGKVVHCMKMPLSHFFSKMNKASDISCSPQVLPLRLSIILVTLLWMLSNSFALFFYCGARNCTQGSR